MHMVITSSSWRLINCNFNEILLRELGSARRGYRRTVATSVGLPVRIWSMKSKIELMKNVDLAYLWSILTRAIFKLKMTKRNWQRAQNINPTSKMCICMAKISVTSSGLGNPRIEANQQKMTSSLAMDRKRIISHLTFSLLIPWMSKMLSNTGIFKKTNNLKTKCSSSKTKGRTQSSHPKSRTKSLICCSTKTISL